MWEWSVGKGVCTVGPRTNPHAVQRVAGLAKVWGGCGTDRVIDGDTIIDKVWHTPYSRRGTKGGGPSVGLPEEMGEMSE